MDIMSMFRSATANPEPAPAPAQAPNNQGQIPATPVVATDPANPTAPVAEPASPLDQFKDLWETKPNEAGDEPTNKPLDAAELQAAVAKADFSKAVTPEMLAQISAGGDGAAVALQQALNSVAQQTMVQSTLVNQKLMEQAVQAAITKQDSSMADKLRSQQAADHLKTTNPLFNNPAIKPVAEAARQQLLIKFPDATSAEITKMTNDYITTMGEAFAPKPVSTAKEGTDWETFLQ